MPESSNLGTVQVHYVLCNLCHDLIEGLGVTSRRAGLDPLSVIIKKCIAPLTAMAFICIYKTSLLYQTEMISLGTANPYFPYFPSASLNTSPKLIL